MSCGLHCLLYWSYNPNMAYLELFETDFAKMDGEGPDRISLDVVDGKRPPLILGRGSQLLPADIKIFARANSLEIISRQHAKIECMEFNCGDLQRPPIYTVACMKALNGTFVNMTRIGKVRLSDGDILQMGGLVSKIQIGDTLPNDDNKNCVKYIFRQPVMVPPSNNNNRRGTKRPSSASTNENNDNNSSSKRLSSSSSSSSKQSISSSSQRAVVGTTTTAAVKETKNRSPPSEEELTSRRDLNTWLLRHGGISGTLADRYSTLLWENGVGTVARLERKLSRDPDNNYLLSIGLDVDDVDDIMRAYSPVNGAHVSVPSVSSSSSSSAAGGGGTVSSVTTTVGTVAATSHDSHSLLSTKRSVEHGNNNQKIKSESDESSIYFSTLRNALVCPLCSLSLLDAVVTPCSHGFCMSCLEQHWSTHNTTVCPVCTGEQSQKSDDPQRQRKQKDNDSKKQNGNGSSSSSSSEAGSGASSSSSRNDGFTRRYVRSVHLDEVVSVLMAASSTMEQKQFAEREKKAYGVLQALGIPMYQPHDHPVESGNKVNNQEGGQSSVVVASQVEETDDDDQENDDDEKDNSSSDSYEDHCSNSRQSYDN